MPKTMPNTISERLSLFRRIASWFVKLLLVLLAATCTRAHVTCTDDDICQELLREGSTCVDGICTNPFVSGCLQNYMPETFHNKRRTCNSQDSFEDIRNGICTPSIFNYPEIRILSQNWESAMFTAWIFQIVLSEMLDVPATIETSARDRNLNFYHPTNSFDYGAVGYDYDALKRASEVGDCANIMRDDEMTYQSCAHFMPEVWNGQASSWRQVEEDGIIEPPSGSGAVGRLGWFIPRYLAEQDDTLLEFLGIQGEENRQKVARTFKRPTTWGDYCNKVISPQECDSGSNNSTAVRAPHNQTEADRYFVDGLYTGHFRATEKNDCTANPDTCTGHIVDIPCDWSTFATSQAHWLGIPVESDGPLEPNGAYSYASLIDIYRAANATKSAVLMYWWKPEAMYQNYLGTEYEMLNVQLTPPSQDCVSSRVSPEQRCSAVFEERIGNQIGGCDGEAHSLVKLIVRNLLQMTFEQTEATRSPAYDFLTGVSISELQIGQILSYWSGRNVDKWNYDPREAVCRWVAENVDYLQIFIPRTYPRVMVQRELDPVWTVALAIACVVSALTIMTSFGVWFFRKHPAIRYAQLPFLGMVLSGLLMTSLGTLVFTAAAPSLGSCTAGTWLVVVGYSLALVPLMVKVATVNRLLTLSRSFQRVKINRHHLYAQVFAMTALIVIVLVVWTIIDPVTNRQELNLTQEQTDNGETIVELSTFCSSESKVWYYVVVGWQILLLLVSAVLVFQNRSVRQEFNESSTLALMIYSHLIFSIGLLVLVLLQDSHSSQQLSGFRYLLYGCDTLATLVIYFAPKFLNVFEKDHQSDVARIVEAIMPRAALMATGSSSASRPVSRVVQITNGEQNNADSLSKTEVMSSELKQEATEVSRGNAELTESIIAGSQARKSSSCTDLVDAAMRLDTDPSDNSICSNRSSQTDR